MFWMGVVYTFCRVHTTLQGTPAMVADLSDHVWSVEEVLRYRPKGSGSYLLANIVRCVAGLASRVYGFPMQNTSFARLLICGPPSYIGLVGDFPRRV